MTESKYDKNSVNSIYEFAMKLTGKSLAEAVQLLSEAQQVNSCTSCTIRTQCSAYALVARHEEPIGQDLVRKAVWCCRGRPATNPDPQLSTYAGSTQITVTSCKRRPFWVLIAIGSHD